METDEYIAGLNRDMRRLRTALHTQHEERAAHLRMSSQVGHTLRHAAVELHSDLRGLSRSMDARSSALNRMRDRQYETERMAEALADSASRMAEGIRRDREREASAAVRQSQTQLGPPRGAPAASRDSQLEDARERMRRRGVSLGLSLGGAAGRRDGAWAVGREGSMFDRLQQVGPYVPPPPPPPPPLGRSLVVSASRGPSTDASTDALGSAFGSKLEAALGRSRIAEQRLEVDMPDVCSIWCAT
jgi:hypothetical protein